jgi:integrase
MPRTIRNPKLDTRSARAKLRPRREPYWQSVTPGCAIGYRKGATGGSWIARRYDPTSTPKRAYHAIGPADDIMDADGAAALSFAHAQEKARKWFTEQARPRLGAEGPYTVTQAMTDYLRWLAAHRRSERTARYRAEACILPALGETKIVDLTADQLRTWLQNLAEQPARMRTRKGEEQQYKTAPDNDETRRKRRASANRTMTILKAALNYAWREGKVPTDAVWRRVKPYEGVETARVRYLTIEEAQRLMNACDKDFRCLVQAALLTGARYGELARLTVADFNPDAGTVAIHQSKSGKSRHVVLTSEGQAFFTMLTAGRLGGELMLTKNGTPWLASHQRRPIIKASKRAKLDPPADFHSLRHTYASLCAMNGVPLMVVAKNLGHTDTRMCERHYSHLAPSYIADAIRAGAPTFGINGNGSVVLLRQTRRRASALPQHRRNTSNA